VRHGKAETDTEYLHNTGWKKACFWARCWDATVRGRGKALSGNFPSRGKTLLFIYPKETQGTPSSGGCIKSKKASSFSNELEKTSKSRRFSVILKLLATSIIRQGTCHLPGKRTVLRFTDHIIALQGGVPHVPNEACVLHAING